MQRALSLLLGRDTELVGAGRTDTGVHASLMAAHFDADQVDCSELARRLNRVLPADIEVSRVVPVSDDAQPASALWPAPTTILCAAASCRSTVGMPRCSPSRWICSE